MKGRRQSVRIVPSSSLSDGVMEYTAVDPPRSTVLKSCLVCCCREPLGSRPATIVHSLLTETGNLGLQHIALVIWPLIAGVPAFEDELVDIGTVVSAQGGQR